MRKNDLAAVTASLHQGPAIIGRKHLKSAAVIVPLVDFGGDYHLLFEKRAAHIPQGSEICFPGGEFDALQDGNLRDTAIRESVEELGLDTGRIEVLGLLGTLVALRGIAIDCYVGIFRIGSIEELRIDTGEVERVFTLPAAWFRENPPQRYPLRVEMHSEAAGTDGATRTLFPARDLGLPPRYWKSWRGGDHTALVYRTSEGVVWGLTAQVVEELTGRW